MRPLFLTLVALLGVVGVAVAQLGGSDGTGQQLPVGQTFKNFQFPIYQEGKLKAVLIAVQAKGITQNRAETSDLTIKIYDDKNAVSTTITSPKADLYVNERKMRTKNTVLIVRANQEASAQSCDFDLVDKKYLLRTNVRVVLMNFDLTKPNPAAPAPPSGSPPNPAAFPPVPHEAPAPPDTVSTHPPTPSSSHPAP